MQYEELYVIVTGIAMGFVEFLFFIAFKQK